MKRLCFSLFILSLILPIFPAETDAEHTCGAVSLYHLATLVGIQVSLDQTETALHAKQEGGRIANFIELIASGKKIGLELQGVKLTYAQLQTFETPVIAHLNARLAAENRPGTEDTVGHFVVVEHATDKWVRLFDAPKPALYQAATVISRDRFLSVWTGKTLVLSQTQREQRKNPLGATPTLRDFGNGKIGEYQVPVQLRNRSGAPIKIRNIAANCNCVVAKQHVKVIPAGETATLSVTWDARVTNRSFFTTLEVQTDAPQRPYTFISFGLLRESSLVFLPENLSLGGVPPLAATEGTQNTFKRTVELRNLNESTVKIQKIAGSQEWIQPVLRGNAAIPPWHTANVDLHFETDQIPRDTIIHETLTVDYQERDGETKTLTLPLSGKVNPRYTLTPNRFFFGRITAAEGKTKAVVLHTRAGNPDIQIEKVDTDVGTVAVKREADENRYALSLTLPPPLPTGILKGEVRIHTTHPKTRLIKVPVFAIVVEN